MAVENGATAGLSSVSLLVADATDSLGFTAGLKMVDMTENSKHQTKCFDFFDFERDVQNLFLFFR